MNLSGRNFLQYLYDSPNLRAFLRVIREGESSQDERAYEMIVGGPMIGNMSRHPEVLVWIERYKVWSSAAGAYQILRRTWQECVQACDLQDFGRESQDVAAVYLIYRRGALMDVMEGRLHEAIRKCAPEWASLPGSIYGQQTQQMDRALAVYQQYEGRLA